MTLAYLICWLIGASELKLATNYDLLRELWISAGLSPTFEGKEHGGFGLDATAKANFNLGKTGHGAIAPILWQRGEIGAVIDYCMEDVRLTVKLMDMVYQGWLVDPRDTSWTLKMRVP